MGNTDTHNTEITTMTDTAPAALPAHLSPGMFRLNFPVPLTATAAWGARGIETPRGFDLPHDRQDLAGNGCNVLALWLNERMPTIKRAFVSAIGRGQVSSRTSDTVILLADATVVVAASCQSSHGHVYLLAWLVPSGLGLDRGIPAEWPTAILPLDKLIPRAHKDTLYRIANGWAYANKITASMRQCVKNGWAVWNDAAPAVNTEPQDKHDVLRITDLGRRALATECRPTAEEVREANRSHARGWS